MLQFYISNDDEHAVAPVLPSETPQIDAANRN
jgi:hypothetical protein